MRSTTKFLLAFFFIQAIFAHGSEKSSRWIVRSEPIRIVNGSPIVFRVVAPRPVQTLSAKWLGHEISFSLEADRKTWFALAGASQETTPGNYALELQGETKSGQRINGRQSLRIVRQRYPKVTLTVPSRYTAPDPEQ